MEKVVNYIRNHGSKENPVHNWEISRDTKIKEVDVRKKINEARSQGIPICSTSQGYYYSEDKAEIVATIQSLMHRTIAVEKAVNGLLTAVMSVVEGGMADGI